MSVDTIIRRRTLDKEIRLSGSLVMSRAEWEARGGVYMGSVGTARKACYYTVRGCLRLAKPVTEEEMRDVTHFAMIKDCYIDQCLSRAGKKVCPCLPVFYRGE